MGTPWQSRILCPKFQLILSSSFHKIAFFHLHFILLYYSLYCMYWVLLYCTHSTIRIAQTPKNHLCFLFPLNFLRPSLIFFCRRRFALLLIHLTKNRNRTPATLRSEKKEKPEKIYFFKYSTQFQGEKEEGKEMHLCTTTPTCCDTKAAANIAFF